MGAFGTFEVGPPWAKAESGEPLCVPVIACGEAGDGLTDDVPFGVATGLPGNGGKERLSGSDWRSGTLPWRTGEMVGLACDPGDCACARATLVAIEGGSAGASAR